DGTKLFAGQDLRAVQIAETLGESGKAGGSDGGRTRNLCRDRGASQPPEKGANAISFSGTPLMPSTSAPILNSRPSSTKATLVAANFRCSCSQAESKWPKRSTILKKS